MFSYKADGRFVVLTTDGKSTGAERQAVFDAIRSDSKVRDGASLIIDLRKYEARLTQSEIQSRVQALLVTLGAKLDSACAVMVRDASLRFGLNFQMAAANMNFRVGVFHDEAAARKWLTPEAESR